jgi:hypothetical protein
MRILLLLAVVGAIAGIAVPNAKALGFEDAPCPPQPQLKVCQPQAEVGKFIEYAITGKGGCAPDSVTYSVIDGALPPGMSVNPGNGHVSGVPTQSGIYTFWLQIKDILAWEGGIFWCTTPDSSCNCARSSQWQFQIQVVQGVQIQQRQSTLPGAQVNQAYNMQFTANTTGLNWTVASGGLPAGLNLNSTTGLLSGTPTTVGEYHFQVKAATADGNRSDTQSYTLFVVEPLRIGNATRAQAEVGRPFERVLVATGGRGPYTWSATGLPAGLTFDAATATISGTPTTASDTSVKITVVDSIGTTTTQDLDLEVAERLSIKRGALPAAKVGSLYSFRLLTVGGVGPFRWSAATGLPTGVKLYGRTGRLYGYARKAGAYRFRVLVTDALGASSVRLFLLKVTAGTARR